MGIDQIVEDMDYICPFCEQGKLSLQLETDQIGTYYNVDVAITMYSWKCDHCGDGLQTAIGEAVTSAAFNAIKEYMEKCNDNSKVV